MDRIKLLEDKIDFFIKNFIWTRKNIKYATEVCEKCELEAQKMFHKNGAIINVNPANIVLSYVKIKPPLHLSLCNKCYIKTLDATKAVDRLHFVVKL
jgi:hypothetical protein